jgi:cell division septation protein DedD/nucleoid DNA-binding protein
MVCRCIADLLIREDKVELPGLGTLLLNYQSASISNAKIVSPPRREMTFELDKNVSDKRIINYIAERENISAEKSNNEFHILINNFWADINNNEVVNWPNIGYFKMIAGQVNFVPDEKSIIFADNIGLNPVNIPQNEAAVESSAIHTQSLANEIKTLQSNKPKRSYKWLYIGILSPIAASFIIILYVFGIFDDAYMTLKGVILSNKNTESGTISNNNNSVENDLNSKTQKRNALLYHETDSIPTSTPEINEANANSETTTTTTNTGASYYLIAGSFKSNKNAQKMAANLKAQGFNPIVLNVGDSIFRVSINSFSNKKEAMQELARILSEGDSMNNSVWLLFQ